jgi:hypothetical protein
VDELAARRVEGEVQLREIQSRVDKANDEILEGMAHRCAAEEVTARVKDLVRAEVMQKNRLLAQASKDADQKSKLEQLFVLQGNSYSTFSWEEIDNATSSFSESRKIGTGSNGTVYKGYLNHLDVAIKVLHSNDSTSTKHFNQEVLPEFCASSSEQIMRQHFILIIFSYHSETVSYLVNESYSFL